MSADLAPMSRDELGMRATVLALLASGLTAFPPPASAQEPLYLRIRPMELADGDADLEAARSMAAREAVWQRAEHRSRLAIASVCTGCLKPDRPLSNPPPTGPALPPRDDGTATEAASAHSPLSLAASR